MLLLDFFTWWYSRGWVAVLKNNQRLLQHTVRFFSVRLLLRTIASPWRRIITYPGASLDAKLRAFGDNLFSRLVGLVVRSVMLLVAAISAGVVAVYSVVTLAAWPLLPLAVPAMIILGATS